MPLTPQQEAEIYPIIDRALDQPPGKGILYKCTAKRADYLARMIQGVRYDSAIESIEMYSPDDPLYGLGSYSHLWVEPHDQGLLATNLPAPHETTMWRLIQCAASQEPVELPGVTINYARQLLIRKQKKYAGVMNHIYVVEGERWPVARYGLCDEEELLVVDIDINPEGRLAAPTDEELAKAGHGTRPPFFRK